MGTQVDNASGEPQSSVRDLDNEATRQWLLREVGDWVRDRLVSQVQGEAILARYGLGEERDHATYARMLVTRVLAAMGALLVGAGVLLVVGANWEVAPRSARLVLLMAVTTGAYLAGYRLTVVRRTYPGVGMALLLTGTLVWGAGIFLVAQMYHLGGSGGEASGVGYWALGAAAVAYVVPSRLHLALAIILAVTAMHMAVMDRRPDLLPLAAVWLTSGAACLSAALLHARLPDASAYRRFAVTWGAAGWLGVFVGLYALTFDLYDRYYVGEPLAAGAVWVVVLAVVAAAGAAAALALRDRRSQTGVWEPSAVLAVCAVAVAAVWFRPLAADPVLGACGQIAANLLLLAASVAAVAVGWMRVRPALVNLGLAVFMVHLVTRYIDLLGGLLPSGVSFVVAGLVLLGVGYFLERQRQRLLQSMQRR